MKIALYELYKALKSKVLLILFVALFLLNLALSATYTPVLGVPDECIREINKVYLSTSEEEKLSVAESIANKYIKDNVLQNIFPDKKYEDKLNRVKNYNTTIRNIKSEAEQRSKPSVFSKENSFTQLSFKDIFTAYNNVIENKPSFYPDYGTERYINSADTDLMMLVFVLMLTVIVCCRDKMTGMAAVIRQTPKGRIHSAGAKLIACFLLTVTSAVLLYGMVLFTGTIRFGLGDLSRCIQSIPQFTLCNINMTVGEYLVIHFLFKTSAFFIVVVVMMIICTFLKNVAAAFAVISVCSGVSIWLYTSISDISAYNILKYINFCCFISPHQLFYRYYHLNIFGKPVSALTVCVITTVIILIMALLIYFAVYCSRRAISASGKISEIFSYITVKRKLSANFVVNEVYKTAIAGKALLVLVVVAVIGFCNYQNMSAGYDSEQKRYDSYVAQIGGEVTDETLLFLENEKLEFENIKLRYEELLTQTPAESDYESYNKELNDITKKLDYENAFNKICDRVSVIKSDKNSNLQLVFEEGFNRLLSVNGYKDDFLMCILATIALVLCISPMIAFDNQRGLTKLLRTTEKGRIKRFAIDGVITLVISAIVFVAVWLPEFVFVMNNYKLSFLDAPLQSITALYGMQTNETILQYIIRVYLIRFFSMLACGFFMLCVSKLSANLITAFSVNILLFVLPLGLCVVSESFVVIWICPYLSGTAERSASPANLIITVIIFIGLILVAGGEGVKKAVEKIGKRF